MTGHPDWVDPVLVDDHLPGDADPIDPIIAEDVDPPLREHLLPLTASGRFFIT